MNRVVQEVIDRLREITGDEEQGFRSGDTWVNPTYVITIGEEENGELTDRHEMEFTPIDYIRIRSEENKNFLAWAKVRTHVEDESKRNTAIWSTVVSAMTTCGYNADSEDANAGYLMAITAAIDEIIKYAKRDSIVDLRALEMANNMLIDQYLNDIYIRQKTIVNGISGAVVTKCRPPMYIMPKSQPFNMLEADNVDRYLKFMETKDKRFKIILDEVVRQERGLDGSRFGVMFLEDTVRFNLIDVDEKVEEKYKLDYIGWAEKHRVDYPQALCDEDKTYRSALKVLYYSHAICDAIGKLRVFSTPGFKLLLEEAQEVLVYSKAHFELSANANDKRYGDIVKKVYDGIGKIENAKFEPTIGGGKDGSVDDLVSRLTLKNNDNSVCINIKVNKAAFQLAYVYVKDKLNISSSYIRDIICLSLLSHAARRYLNYRPLSRATDGWDVRMMDAVESTVIVPFIDAREDVGFAANLIDGIGGVRCEVDYSYQILTEI